jgi:hypothetical protein
MAPVFVVTSIASFGHQSVSTVLGVYHDFGPAMCKIEDYIKFFGLVDNPSLSAGDYGYNIVYTQVLKSHVNGWNNTIFVSKCELEVKSGISFHV